VGATCTQRVQVVAVSGLSFITARVDTMRAVGCREIESV